MRDMMEVEREMNSLLFANKVPNFFFQDSYFDHDSYLDDEAQNNVNFDSSAYNPYMSPECYKKNPYAQPTDIYGTNMLEEPTKIIGSELSNTLNVSSRANAVKRPSTSDSKNVAVPRPKPYVCQVCFRAFARHEHLSRHERSHTKEKPFVCQPDAKNGVEGCGRAFARKDLLLRHQQKIHKSPCPRKRSKQLSNSSSISKLSRSATSSSSGSSSSSKLSAYGNGRSLRSFSQSVYTSPWQAAPRCKFTTSQISKEFESAIDDDPESEDLVSNLSYQSRLDGNARASESSTAASFPEDHHFESSTSFYPEDKLNTSRMTNDFMISEGVALNRSWSMPTLDRTPHFGLDKIFPALAEVDTFPDPCLQQINDSDVLLLFNGGSPTIDEGNSRLLVDEKSENSNNTNSTMSLSSPDQSHAIFNSNDFLSTKYDWMNSFGLRDGNSGCQFQYSKFNESSVL